MRASFVATIAAGDRTLDTQPFYALELAKFWAQSVAVAHRGASCEIRGGGRRWTGRLETCVDPATSAGVTSFVWRDRKIPQ